jgi:2,4-dienoyl-CoA reductase-like NADH-dependent reductase (Old Yellow Enzyme family)/NADPH-dependent 2,4-dienoyl-CoA reductase/sulfur reductase-like enzyme
MTGMISSTVTKGQRRLHTLAGGPVGFPNLMSPARIGRLRLPNRILMAAMDMNLCEDGEIEHREIEHLAARARGGTALVTTGAAAVAFPAGATSLKQPGLSDDRFLPGLRALADGVHAAGGRVSVQLCHHGKTSAVDTAQGRPLLVPSLPLPKSDMSALVDTTNEERAGLGSARRGRRDTYREATEDDLREVVRAFAEAARRCETAGIDAVEVHAGHGYLLSTFLSAGYNRRTDRYGGDTESRARLVCEVVAAIRAAVTDGYPVVVKLNGQEFMLEHGMSADEVVAVTRLLEAAGADAIQVSGYSNDPFGGFTLGPLPDEVAAYRGVTRRVKQAVGIPVIAVGRVLPETAEEMVAAGDCDLVAEGRWLLTDPDLANKLGSGRRASVRPCINCYVCAERNFFDDTPLCTVNPTLRDPEAAEPPPAEQPRRVVVVGGGPAGMEAARVAAHRGHVVTLLEAAERLGGTAWFSELTTPENGPFLRWQEHQLELEGVDVRTGVSATVEGVWDLHPDVVVVATGARRGRPDVPGADLPHVRSGDDLRALLTGGSPAGARSSGRSLLERVLVPLGRTLRLTNAPRRIRLVSKVWMPVGRDVVVVGGGLVGLELAEFLVRRRRRVTLLENGPVLGLPMAMPRRLATATSAASDGVRLVRGARLVQITADHVVYEVAGEQQAVTAETVVLTGEVRPDATLADRLRESGTDVRVIGDADVVGYLYGAVHSGWRVGLEL